MLVEGREFRDFKDITSCKQSDRENARRMKSNYNGLVIVLIIVGALNPRMQNEKSSLLCIEGVTLLMATVF